MYINIKQKLSWFDKYYIMANRWVKRGIYVVPMNFPLSYFGTWSALVSIYFGDGSVAVAHGGVEMGQGINTKVAQVCAYALGIPLDQVSIKPSNTLTTPNGYPTAGSITSEAVCYATLQCCETLKKRMQPVKDKMNNPSWKDLVNRSYIENIDLMATHQFHSKLPDIKSYRIYGIAAAEVEVDLLTGLHQVRRLDIQEDTGNSMSPEVDIGQVEGAFIMGIGYWTTEQLVFGPDGELLTNRTWNYKPPGAKDIPVDFRVKFPKNNPNPGGILKSKATAEPPQNMACVVPLAIRNAVNSARAEANPKAGDWLRFNGPSTVEQTFQESLHDYKQYTL